MMDSLGRIIAVILAIVLILLYPLQYVAGSQTETMNHMIEHYSAQFTDTVRKEGNISIDIYEDYIEKLSYTGELFDIEIEHARPKTASDILAENTLPGVLLASTRADFLPVYEPSISSLINNTSISPLSTHTHTNDCYDGHRHDDSCVPAGDMSVNVYFKTTYYEEYDYYGAMACYYTFTLYCAKCNNIIYVFSSKNVIPGSASHGIIYANTRYHTYDSNGNVYEKTYNNNIASGMDERFIALNDKIISLRNYLDNLPVSTRRYTEETYYRTTYCKDSVVFKWNLGNYKTIINEENAELPYIGCVYNGIYGTNLSCGLVEDTTTECHQVVTSITATNPSQTIMVGGSIITTATATYLDGHKGTVNCSVSGFDNTKLGSQTVTLTYSGKVGNAKTTGTRTCTVTVTVIAGLEYITVVPSATTVYNGSEPTYTVTAHYGNGTSKTLASSQYTKSGWSSGPGTKTVTFSYTESGKTVTASVTITVKPNVLRLDVTPSATTVYNGVEPTYTVKVVYENNTSITLTSSQYTRSGWSSGPGTKTVTFTYTENNKTVSKSVTITVKPNVSSITVTPSTQSVERYKNPSFTVRVNYENGTSAVTTSYTMTGFNNKNLGTQTVTFSYTENGITKTATAKVTVTNMTKVCPVCGTRYQLDNNDVDQGCPSCKSTIDYIVATPDNITLYQGENLPIMVTAVYRNGHRAVVTGWTSNYDPMKIGIQNITITYQGHKAYVSVHVQAKVKKCPVCNETYPLNPDGTDGGCPYCKETIVKIDVTPKTVTINLHQPLPIVVTAYYRDGHTAVVNDWSTSFIPDRAGEYSVTITYKTVSEVIKVIVKDSNITTCFYCGTEYNKLEHPQGCPVCAATIIGIEARLRDGGNKVYQGSKLNLEIILTFRDEHREIRYTGYTVSNYYPNKLGEQTVTVHYEGHSTNLTIVVIPLPAIKICPNGHEYYLNEDGTDPGCPFCFNLSGERNILYYEITYTGEILEALYSQEYYEMRAGDYITVIVTNRNTSLRARIKKLFRQTLDKETKMVFGGEVSGASD